MKENSRNTCLNCENEMNDHFIFCPNCGQKNTKLSLKFKDLLSEFISSNFNLDSKIFKTVKTLITSPAKLTTEFLKGKRNTYMHPIRLFLLTNLLYFAIVSLNSEFQEGALEIKNDRQIENNISEQTNLDLTIDNKNISENEKIIIEKIKLLNSKSGRKLFLKSIQKYLSAGMFFLVPITALIFLLLFFKGTYYIQHLIFTIHLQSLVFMLFIIINLIELFFQSVFILYLEGLLFTAILFLWIKSFYKLKSSRTIWKMILFILSYSILISIFFIISVGFSFLEL